MRRLITASVLLLLPLTLASAENQAKHIDWQHDLEKAMELSKKDGRPLIAYFTFDT